MPPGGIVLFDRTLIEAAPALDRAVRAIGVPFTRIASEIGLPMVKNIVALGALQQVTGLFPKEAFLAAIRRALRQKGALIPQNEEAFARGGRAAREGTETES